jgi:hypothetical protein
MLLHLFLRQLFLVRADALRLNILAEITAGSLGCDLKNLIFRFRTFRELGYHHILLIVFEVKGPTLAFVLSFLSICHETRVKLTPIKSTGSLASHAWFLLESRHPLLVLLSLFLLFF